MNSRQAAQNGTEIAHAVSDIFNTGRVHNGDEVSETEVGIWVCGVLSEVDGDAAEHCKCSVKAGLDHGRWLPFEWAWRGNGCRGVGAADDSSLQQVAFELCRLEVGARSRIRGRDPRSVNHYSSDRRAIHELPKSSSRVNNFRETTLIGEITPKHSMTNSDTSLQQGFNDFKCSRSTSNASISKDDTITTTNSIQDNRSFNISKTFPLRIHDNSSCRTLGIPVTQGVRHASELTHGVDDAASRAVSNADDG